MFKITSGNRARRADTLQMITATALFGALGLASARGAEVDPECRWSPATRLKSVVCPGDPDGGSARIQARPLIPRVDVEASCEKHVQSGTQHDREIRRNVCLRGEQRAYDHLKLIEDDLDEKILNDCEYALKMQAFQYQALDQCASAYLTVRQRQRELNTRPPPFRY